ncbi:hypothetical protein [Niveispirillum sp. BGYR6]|uniref:hypothetical protein n=1 Tax=Niveispirillum sp. BGYR6 TaxID=2971249 RepID=UPI0022B9C466|nr:hypothetical protein [Niveispirillum sp. BGYR6]
MTAFFNALNRSNATESLGATRNAPAQVIKAVQQASSATGVDFSYLMDKANVESGYRTDVKAKTSSATGLFQFTEGTWLNMVQQHGAEHGLGKYANQITTGANGKPQVSDPAMRKEILNLRKDPRYSALLAAELASDNKDHLEGKLGRPVGNTEMYMAHFLGAGGATKFLKAMEKNPNQIAANLLPDAAKANLNVFYDGTRPLTVGQIFDRFSAKFDDAPAQFADSSNLGTQQATDETAQPWLTGYRSGASGREPISTFTIMMLDSLAPPSADEEEKKRATGGGTRGEKQEKEQGPTGAASGQSATPSVIPGMLAA